MWKKKSFYWCSFGFSGERHRRLFYKVFELFWHSGICQKYPEQWKWLPVGTDLEKSWPYNVDYHIIKGKNTYLNVMKNMPQCLKSCQWFVMRGVFCFHAPYNVVCSSCDPAAHRPCHLVLCPPCRGHLVSHMEGTGRTPQLAASPLKHSFCLHVSLWMDHCPSSKRDRDKIFSVSIPVMFNQSLRQIYEV